MAAFGDGLAVGADLVEATDTAVARATAGLAGHRADLMIGFVHGEDVAAIEAALHRLAELAGAATVLGCSVPGVIAGGRGVEETPAVAVWCAALPDAQVRSFALRAVPAAGGLAVLGMPEQQLDDAVAVLLADPWSFPVDGFVAESNTTLPGLPVVGGLAVGPDGHGSTRLLVDGRVVDEGAVGVVLGGAVDVHPLVSQGCRPVGPTMTVTAAEGNLLLELAGAPALAKLEEIVTTLPPEEQSLVATGLQIGITRDEYVDEQGQGDFLIRGVAGADEARGALAVGDVVPVGRTVRFQVRDAVAADADLRATLDAFRDRRSRDVQGALLFSCNGRGAGLFGTPDHDPEVVRSQLVGSGVAGCFAAGEIGPVAGRNFVHGFTASILAFSAT
ncbi:MAG TPA: FIST N-terminal domain-containing protein [Mycobacteriales bacterium]|nr:FIST N-terminal domain-containing protein [Mycobacteriales bacterium]